MLISPGILAAVQVRWAVVDHLRGSATGFEEIKGDILEADM
jgi:hypothetical protein